jgi:transposase
MANTNKRKGKGPGGARMLPVLHPDAAGIDVGAEERCSFRFLQTVRLSRYDHSKRSPAIFMNWPTGCRSCGVRSVTMESTGVYWIPLFQILESRGFEVFLVNAQHVKNVPGRKSDVSDCQWIQYLHAVGLLKASFRPPDQICVVRSLWRHREGLVQNGRRTHDAHDKKVSGGKVLYTGSRKVKNRIAIALWLGAQCLYHAKNYLGEYYRKMKWRLGAPQALTATAHKLARIVFHMLLTKEPYNESVLVKWNQQANMRAQLRLKTLAAKLGFDLTPAAEPQQ